MSGYSDALTYMRQGGGPTRVTAQQIEESVDKSLARLGTDHVDLLQIHWPDRYVPLFGAASYDINQVALPPPPPPLRLCLRLGMLWPLICCRSSAEAPSGPSLLILSASRSS